MTRQHIQLLHKVLGIILSLAMLAQASPLLAMHYESLARHPQPPRASFSLARYFRLPAPQARPQNLDPAAAPNPTPPPAAVTTPAPVTMAAPTGSVSAREGPQRVQTAALVQTEPSLDEIPLRPNWNLLSLPKEPPDSDPAAVFADIAGDYDVVFAYDACDTGDPWRVYDPVAPPATNDLATVDHTAGFWLQANTATTLPISGTLPPSTTVQLCEGWNLISLPVAQPRAVRSALASIEGKYTRVFGYDPDDATDPWAIFDVSAPDWANDLQVLEPGRGYWVLASEDTSLAFVNEGPAPVVEILAPASSPTEITTVTFITDVVGTVESDLLQDWRLQFRPHGEDHFTKLASGVTPVTAAALGQFDPTLLLNGIYEIVLEATDFTGQTVATSVDVAVEGQAKIGHFTLSFIDLEIPVAGLPIQVIRTYDSRDKRQGDFGFGWTLSLRDVRLQENGIQGLNWQGTVIPGPFPGYCVQPTRGHIVTITLPDDTIYKFKPVVSPDCQSIAPQQVVNISYEPLPGTHATLKSLDQDEPAVVVGNFPGPIQLFDQATFTLYDPNLYELTLQDGRAFIISQEDGLQRVTDLNGNTLTFSDSGITHSSGKSVTFVRDGEGRITTISDPNGNPMTYGYNANGDLVRYTDREGNETTFTYLSSVPHHLDSIKDPLGNIPIRNEYDADNRLIAQIDANGNRTEFNHDLIAMTSTVTDRLGNATHFVYNSRGLLTQSTAGSLTIQSTYDSRGNKLTETDQLGNIKHFTYDANNNLTSESDALGNTITYDYDTRARLNVITDADGNSTSFSYDANGNLSAIQNAAGVTVGTFSYTANGEISEVTTLGGATTFTYDTFGNVVVQQGPGGMEINATYDANGNRLTQRIKRTVGGVVIDETTLYSYNAEGNLLSITDPLGNVDTFTYDALGRLLTKSDALGHTTSFTYDSRGNLVRKEYPDGTFETFGYDEENRKIAETDRAGRTTRFEYDVQDNLTRILYADGKSIVNTYDAKGNLINFTNENNLITTFGYNANGQLTSITNPLGNSTNFAYNANGARISMTDPLGNTTQFAYDELNFGMQRLIKTIFADGMTTQRTYAESGRLASQTDEAGQATSFDYDAAGNLIRVTNALAGVTSYTYDEVGNLTSQSDANGHTTTFEYNANHQITRRTLPLGMSETFTYDPVGNMAAHINFNGETTQFEYDAMNRLIRKVLPNGATVIYTYTPTGELATISDVRGVTRFSYDDRNRLTQVENPDGTVLTYAYDAVGNRTAVTGPTGITAYRYDAANRLASVTDPEGGVTDYSYDAADNLIMIRYPNGVEAHHTYDRRSRPIVLEYTDSGGTPILARYEYSLDPVGNRTRLLESGGRIVDYTYDVLYRLIREEDNLGGSVAITSYTYDAVGNRLTMDNNGTVTNYTYDDNDRLLAAGTQTFNYDDNGNLISRDTGEGVAPFVYGYDSQNRVVSQVAPNGTASTFVYDDFGNRVQREVADVVTQFLVDPMDNSDLPQVLAEFDDGGAVTAAYTYGLDLIRLRRGTTNQYYHTDGLGSTRLLTDLSGTVSDVYDYDAFGNLLTSTGATPNAYLFAGEQLDPNLNLYYLRARYFDQTVGRFTTMDPILGSVLEPQTLHRYSYAANNPVNNIDPTGQFTLATASLSLGIHSTLARIATLSLVTYRKARTVSDFIVDLLAEIPRMELNREATREKLGEASVNLLSYGIGDDLSLNAELGVNLNVELGNGAVAKAFAISSDLAGPAHGFALIHARNAAAWMAALPLASAEKAENIPGGYLACGFNHYLSINYNLKLVNNIVPESVTMAIGVWFAYTNFLTLVAETHRDVASETVPPQPPANWCGRPGA